MLSVSEFTCGTISDASPLALVLPRNKYEQLIIVGQAGEKRVAVFIGESYKFDYFDYETNDSWSGLIVGGVEIEIDESTVFNPRQIDPPLGAIVREGNHLSVFAKKGQSFSRSSIPLIEGLPNISEGYSVGFLRWQVVIGKQTEKRVLATIDVRQTEAI